MSLGFDSYCSGILYQDLILENLTELEFKYKCDSLSGMSRCFIEIFGIDSDSDLELIYQDSIIEEYQNFENYIVSTTQFLNTSLDSIRLQFTAKGAGGFVDDDVKGHTMFLIDVQSKYLTYVMELVNELNICPNPQIRKRYLKRLWKYFQY